MSLAVRDNRELRTYAAAMERGHPYIQLRLNVPDAIEVGDFISAFTAVASEFDRFMRDNHPDAAPDAGLFVKEVRQGSIIAALGSKWD